MPRQPENERELHAARTDRTARPTRRKSAAPPREQRPSAEALFQARSTRLHEWRQRFLTARRLDERIKLMADFGLTDRDIAKAVPDVTPRSVRRWRAEGAPTTRLGDRWEPIDDLCAIIGYFLSDGTYDEESILAWLRSRQPSLDSERPLDVISGGDFDAVRRAAQEAIALTTATEDELAPFPTRSHRHVSANHGGE